jgi:phenylalanyl-tRNA synthetase beta chain
MKLTYSWLLRHLETTASLSEILEKLTTLGLEVESCHNPAERLDPFIIGEIQGIQPHPNADRLKICQVYDGKATHQIVCGAPNARSGLKVVLAKPGVVIPATGKVLKVGKIRDIESYGMLCSSDELGLETEQAAGILELGSDAIPGVKLIDYLQLNDPILEIGLTPNRPDCTGVRGIARDLAAAGLGTLKPLEIDEIQGTFKAPQTVTLESLYCPYYLGRFIKNVQNSQSPAFIQRYLRAIGLEPISAIVDFTNFITHDIGRPAHVYDADKISQNLRVRQAHTGEKIEALNNKVYDLTSEDGVIADNQDVLSLGGIIGSVPSGCAYETCNVFLEVAYFDPIAISKTGRRHNIITDSRYRMERGVDKRGCELGMAYLTYLITTYCGGEVSEVIVVGEPPKLAGVINFDWSLISKRLGMSIAHDVSREILEKIGMKVEEVSAETLKVTPPSWRPDITIPEDLVEEIIRVYGYEHIPSSQLPALTARSVVTPQQQKLFHLKAHLATLGFNESINWSMIPEAMAHLFEQTDACLKIKNPITQELAWMRPSLICQLLEDLKRKLHKGRDHLHIFESGHVFHGLAENLQPLHLAGVRYGLLSEETWENKSQNADFYVVKKDALSCLSVIGLNSEKVRVVAKGFPSWYHPGRSASLMLGTKICLGYFGEIHPIIQKFYDITKPIYAFELLLDTIPIKARKTPNKGILSPSKFQSLYRDFSFFVASSVPLGTLVDTFKKADPSLVSKVQLFDVYQGHGVPDGKISVSIRITITPQNHTLSEEEIKVIYKSAIELATAIEGVEFRL